MKVTFKQGERFLMEEELYNAILVKIEKQEMKDKSKGVGGLRFTFEIMDDEELKEGKGSTFGKQLNLVYWANGVDDEGDFTFPLNGKFKNAITNLAISKKLDITDEDFEIEDLIGCYGRVMINNSKTDAGDVYSNIDGNTIKPAKATTKEVYKEWKNRKEDEDEEEKPKKKKKPVEDDDDDDDEPKPKKKKPVEDDDFEDDEPPKKKKKPVVEDEEDDEPPKKKKKKIEDDDFDDEEEKPKKKKKPAEDDDDLFD